jgi:hypothetical protein
MACGAGVAMVVVVEAIAEVEDSKQIGVATVVAVIETLLTCRSRKCKGIESIEFFLTAGHAREHG